MISRSPWTSVCDDDPTGVACAEYMAPLCNTGYDQPVSCAGSLCWYDPKSTTMKYRSAMVDPSSGCSAWYYATSLRGVSTVTQSLSDYAISTYCSSTNGQFTPECSCLNFIDVPAVNKYCNLMASPGTDPNLCEVTGFRTSDGTNVTSIQFNMPDPYYCWYASCHENQSTQLLNSTVRGILGTGDQQEWYFFTTITGSISTQNPNQPWIYQSKMTSVSGTEPGYPRCSPICIESEQNAIINAPVTVPNAAVQIGAMIQDCASGAVPSAPMLVVPPVEYQIMANEPSPYLITVNVSNSGSEALQMAYMSADDPWIEPRVQYSIVNGVSSTPLQILIDLASIPPTRDPETGTVSIVGVHTTTLHYTSDPLRRTPVPSQYVADVPITITVLPPGAVTVTETVTRVSTSDIIWISVAVFLFLASLVLAFRISKKKAKAKAK